MTETRGFQPVAAPQRQEEHYLFSDRDNTESERLNKQSETIALLRNHRTLEPNINSPWVTRVADVATGTGIWLNELSRQHCCELQNPNVEYVGFDISSVQFPTTTEYGMKFVVADMHAGFPEEYLGTFDIVHIRLVILAIEKGQFDGVLRNLLSLLRPGGWLQWDDLSFTRGADSTFPSTIRSDGQIIVDHYVKSNWSLNIVGDVVTALLTSTPPVAHVQIRDYRQDNFGRKDMQKRLVEWKLSSSARILELTLMRDGCETVEVEKMVREFKEKVVRLGEQGVVLPMPLVSITAQKPPGPMHPKL